MGVRDLGRPSLGPGPTLVLQWTLPWPYNTPNMALYILAIVLHSMQQKWDQGTLGTQSSTLTGSRTRLGPTMDPAIALQYTQDGPLYIGYIGSAKKIWVCKKNIVKTMFGWKKVQKEICIQKIFLSNTIFTPIKL